MPPIDTRQSRSDRQLAAPPATRTLSARAFPAAPWQGARRRADAAAEVRRAFYAAAGQVLLKARIDELLQGLDAATFLDEAGAVDAELVDAELARWRRAVSA